MPTHWESSKRPLFVRTVFVNGSRHAILSQEDPLSQGPSGKQSRPSSSQSYVSGSSVRSTGSRSSEVGVKRRPLQGGTTMDLQNCIVKLRLVLANHRVKAKTALENKAQQQKQEEVKKSVKVKSNPSSKQKRKKSGTAKTKKKSLRYHEDEDKSRLTSDDHSSGYHQTTKYYRYDKNHNIVDEPSYYIMDTSSEVSQSSQHSDTDKSDPTVERQLCECGVYNPLGAEKHSSIEREDNFSYNKNVFSTIHGPGHDIPWNSISADSYFTRPYYNPLSERVLQWLDLASKRSRSTDKQEQTTENITADTIERIYEGQTFLDENNMAKYRDKTKHKKNRMRRSKSEVKVIKRDVSPVKVVKEPSVEQNKEFVGPTEEEDVEEEVRQEGDVDTVLSTEIVPREYPKYSKALNKLHSMKSICNSQSIDKTKQQNSENTNTTDDSSNVTVKKDNSPAEEIPRSTKEENEVDSQKERQKSDRRGVLTRQPKLQDESDIEEERDLKIKSWYKNQTAVRQRRTAFSQRNSLFNKPLESNQTNTKQRKDAMRRSNRMTGESGGTDQEGDLEVFCRPICQQASLSPRLQNRIPWLRDYQTGGRNMWPSDKATSKPQLHIFMPAIETRTSEGEVGEEGSTSDCESFLSEAG